MTFRIDHCVFVEIDFTQALSEAFAAWRVAHGIRAAHAIYNTNDWYQAVHPARDADQIQMWLVERGFKQP